MKKQTKSLLEEINSISPKKNKLDLLESRGTNTIVSIINLIEMVESYYDPETASDIVKRIHLSIKNRDTDRFQRGLKKLRENK